MKTKSPELGNPTENASNPSIAQASGLLAPASDSTIQTPLQTAPQAAYNTVQTDEELMHPSISQPSHR